jgi:hypothetical protein
VIGRIAVAFVLLVLGAITTLAIAWLSGLYVPLHGASTTHQLMIDEQETPFDCSSRSAFGVRWTWLTVGVLPEDEDREIIPMPAYLEPPPVVPRPGQYNRMEADFLLVGWPQPCLMSRSVSNKPGYGTGVLATWDDAIAIDPGVPGDPFTARILPIRPLVGGLVTNILLFTAAWTVLFIGGRSGVRWSRRRRGLCPWCRYRLRESRSRTCPECGRSAMIVVERGGVSPDAPTGDMT